MTMKSMPSQPWTGFSLLLLLCRIQLVAATSTISTFSDENCENSFKSFDGPNGFPDGTCSALSRGGKFSSFQIVQLDPGCAVTIYGANIEGGSPCSSTTLQVGELTECYNSTWNYYSIDGCTKPVSTESSSSSPTSSSTSSISSISTSSISPTATATSPPSFSSSSAAVSEGSRTNYAGPIAGGIIGGFALLAIVIALIWFFWYRRRRLDRQRQSQDLNGDLLRDISGPYAVGKPPHHEHKFHESDSPKMPAAGFRDIQPPRELAGSIVSGPVELEGEGTVTSTPTTPNMPR